MPPPAAIVPPGLLPRLAAAYRRAWRLPLALASADGQVRAGELPHQSDPTTATTVALAIAESLRWGEPAIQVGPRGLLVFAVPVMHNARLLAGLVSAITERRLFRPGTGGTNRPRLNLQAAATGLRQLAEEHNLTNAALLAQRRETSLREQQRAEAIHAYKLQSGYQLRTLYLLDEPALIAAMRNANRAEARSILNRLLTAMIHTSGGRIELLKGFLMELVATLARTAVEAGGAPEELLGRNFASLQTLAAIRDEEALSGWLRTTLEHMLDAIERNRPKDPEHVIAAALTYLRQHALEELSRDQVARAAGVSPTHLSRLLNRHVGKSLPALVHEVRIARAADLLTRTDKPLKLIALETGFKDQSHFTKVFRRHVRKTPRQYRLQNAGERG